MPRIPLVQDLVYSACVLLDRPVGYWRMTERIGSKVARNLGTGGVGMCGYYTKAVVFEAPGPVQNDDLNRACRFGRDAKHPAMDIRYSRFSKQTPTQSCSVILFLFFLFFLC